MVTRPRLSSKSPHVAILDAWSEGMIRLARQFVSTPESAREVVQETWIAVVRGLAGFEGRSSLRTWVFRILVNTAKRRGVQEQRAIPMSSLQPTDEDTGPTVAPERFQDGSEPYPGHWKAFPTPWPDPEQALLDGEVRTRVAAALDLLPSRQRTVIELRDVLGHDADEVCAILDISAANQRVLLHRARAFVRGVMEEYFTAAETPRRRTTGASVNDDLDCNELVELVTDYLDGALDDAEVARVAVHLRVCDGCDSYLAQFRATIHVLGGQHSPSLADEARENLLAAFRSIPPQ